MPAYKRICSLGVQPSDNDNRITVEWAGQSYTINQRALKRYATAAEAKAALEKFLGYPVTDLWFHINRDGTWAVATGADPGIWPEDEP